MADKKGDKKTEKKAATPDDIMTAGDIRGVLAQAKRGNSPGCAIAMTKDKDGVILVDKRAKPKKLLAELKKKAAGCGLELETTTLRFGRASVDPDVDASLLTLTVNKDAPGALRPKILEVLKKAGFAKLEIIVDAALENESEEDEAAPAGPAAAQADPQTGGAPPQQPALAADASPTAPDPATTPASSPDAAPQAPAQAPVGPAAGPDLSALTGRLTDLVRSIAGLVAGAPAQAAPLKALATDAQAALKAARQTGDAASAAAGIDALERALAAAAAQAGAGATPAVNVAALAKASKAWLATRQKVESDIAKLRTSFADAFKEHEHADALTAGFEARVETVMTGLDEELAHRLAEVTSTTDPAAHAKMVVDAKKIIQRYEAFLSSDPTIAEIDANPLVPLAIQKTLTATLEILNRAVV